MPLLTTQALRIIIILKHIGMIVKSQNKRTEDEERFKLPLPCFLIIPL